MLSRSKRKERKGSSRKTKNTNIRGDAEVN
jgi:hypothetical protein